MKTRKKGLLNVAGGKRGVRFEFPHGSFMQRYYGQLKSDGITTIGIPSERYPIGTGWVAIPSNISREEYIETCMRNSRIGIFLESGDFVWDIPIDRDRLQDIDFPNKYGELGSAVAYINVPKHNLPIVVAVLNKADDSQDYKEHRRKIRKETEESFAEVIVDGKGCITINAQSESTATAQLNLILGSRDNDGKLMGRIYGEVDIDHYGTFKYRTSKEILIQVDDPDADDLITTIKYVKGEGFSYIDEFENKIILEDQKMTLESPEILHGENATEPAVLGDTLEDLLGQLIDAITALTVPTGVGPSGVPVNAAQFIAIKNQLLTFKSSKNKIE